jgi:ubiquinone/menaquinone biosynthesis C-methylase UbiE
MADSQTEQLKAEVRDFWNQQSCDTQMAAAPKFSKEYFEQIESFRYRDQPFIHGFAQFSRYRDKRVLEVGFGAGTDFIQWVRAGARACGIDLTPEALENLTHRITAYGLPAPEQITVGDAETLPFESESFDLGYSFGVLHHSPNTEKAISELVRVVRPGGEIKIMLYNRHSICVVNQWIKSGLLKGKPFQSLGTVLWNHFESVGTKAYTRAELHALLGKLPLQETGVHTEITSTDYLAGSAMPALNFLYRLILRFAGYSRPWNLDDFVQPGASEPAAVRPRPKGICFTGNRFGFFHCITAVKRPIV